MLKSKILFTFVIILVLVTFFVWLGIVIFVPSQISNKDVYIYIDKGTSTYEIAKYLSSKGLIRNKYVFVVLGRLKNLKFGEYKINKNSNMWQIINILEKGGTLYHTITIPEGYTSFQIAELLQERGITTEEEFLKYVNMPELFGMKGITSLEGYLFPDTYFVKRGESAKKIIEMMLRRFNEVVPDEIDTRAKELGITPYQVIILASLVEKEAKVPQERPIIASVFLNRHKKKMRLESCSTVQYALGQKKYRKLSYDDLKVNSPYNTYLVSSFPPTPISNPGLSAIKSSLWPDENDYLYFVSKGDGTHIFSKTYKEHLAAKNNIKQNSIKK